MNNNTSNRKLMIFLSIIVLVVFFPEVIGAIVSIIATTVFILFMGCVLWAIAKSIYAESQIGNFEDSPSYRW